MDLFTSLFDYLAGHFTKFGYRTYWVFLLTALLLAFGVYLRQSGRDWSLRGFWHYAFPKNIWWHKSSRIDYVYFAINAFVMVLFVAPIAVLAYPSVMGGFMGAFEALQIPALKTPPPGASVMYFIAFILVGDFMIFLSHYLQHKVPFLWQFHKVHHAAEVLNPMTLYRQHPLDFLLSGVMFGIGTATVHALFSYMFSSPFSIFTFGALNLVTLAFYLLGYNLRHSHISLSFGKFADRWLISPVQHQLHHSCIEKHFDKNMGLIFAIWDRLFRTHYIPAKDEPIELGLPNHEAEEFSSAYQCYVLPFKKAFKSHKIATPIVLASMMGAGTLSLAADSYTPQSLHLEALTWTEVDEAIKAGYRKVIIPTGGTEQNGPHVILGKHNHVIKYTAEQIALGVGDTLIAPVMAYVPEGSPNERIGHMRFTGTLSIREEAFEMVLEDTAKSLFTHGFTDIYILGDSGDSVAAQARAVAKIQTELQPNQRIFHITDYYENHGQGAWLQSQGYSVESIGTHAGMRDTSELLAVAPEGVRRRGLRQTSQSKGANGAYWKASPEIGQTMLELKIEAAIAQIEELSAPTLLSDNAAAQP